MQSKYVIVSESNLTEDGIFEVETESDSVSTMNFGKNHLSLRSAMINNINIFTERLLDLGFDIIGNTLESFHDIALVTGGSGGLGFEIVKLFANRGVKTIILDLVPPQGPLPNHAFYYQCDVSNVHDVSRVYQIIHKQHGTVTVLVNNAGVSREKPLEDLDTQDIETIINVNFVSGFYMINAFLPGMMEAQKGYIINVASVLGLMSPAMLTAYGASKGGLIALHESVTNTLSGKHSFGVIGKDRSNIKTLLVTPGQIKTNMFSNVKTPSSTLAPILEPECLAIAIVNAIKQGRRDDLKLPYYANFIPLFKGLPWPVIQTARTISGIDRSVPSL